MAFKEQTIRYQFDQAEKVAMIMVLEQYPEYMTTIYELKNMLMVDGGIILDSHYAVLLARIIHPHYPQHSEKLLEPIETYQAMTPNKWQARFFELVNR